MPITLEDTLLTFNKNSYPNIYYIMCTLLLTPVTSSGVERAHSALKFIKTPHRSTMGQDRLVALMLLFVHRDIPLDYNKVIDKYATKNLRRMMLINPIGDVQD